MSKYEMNTPSIVASRTDRNSAIELTYQNLRRLADPENRLPEVEVYDQDRATETIVNIRQPNGDGLNIGIIALSAWSRRRDLPIRVSRVKQELRGQGYGIALYLGAAAVAYARGQILTSDHLVSHQAANVWNRLEKRGLADITEPFSWRGDQKHSYLGHARFKSADELLDLLENLSDKSGLQSDWSLHEDDIWDW